MSHLKKQLQLLEAFKISVVKCARYFQDEGCNVNISPQNPFFFVHPLA